MLYLLKTVHPKYGTTHYLQGVYDNKKLLVKLNGDEVHGRRTLKKRLQVEAAASPPGTTIEVRQLFYNLPARRKFLKTKETEKSHISQYLRLAALAHPEVGFKLIQDQRTLWHLNPIECDGSPDSRMQALEERMQQIEKNTWQRLAVQFKDTIQTKVHQESGDHFEEEK